MTKSASRVGGMTHQNTNPQPRWKSRFCTVAIAAAMLIAVTGCAEKRGGSTRLELQWYTPTGGCNATAKATCGTESGFWMEDVTDTCTKPAVDPCGVACGDYTVTTLGGDRKYDFEYLLPHREDVTLYGTIYAFETDQCWARKFVRHSFMVLDPAQRLDVGQPASIIDDQDIDRVMSGDVVEKVVFVADLMAIDRRITMIDRELRRIRDLETRLEGQLEYWNSRRTERRWNALYGGDYGEDVPSPCMAIAQAWMGAESYHWYRYSEADDMVQTYKEDIAELAIPVERLREERGALQAMLATMKVIHRRGETVVATMDMTRKYHDAFTEVTQIRNALHGPYMEIDDPYGYSTKALGKHYKRELHTNTGMLIKQQPIGQIVMDMRIGPRKMFPVQLSCSR